MARLFGAPLSFLLQKRLPNKEGSSQEQHNAPRQWGHISYPSRLHPGMQHKDEAYVKSTVPSVSQHWQRAPGSRAPGNTHFGRQGPASDIHVVHNTSSGPEIRRLEGDSPHSGAAPRQGEPPPQHVAAPLAPPAWRALPLTLSSPLPASHPLSLQAETAQGLCNAFQQRAMRQHGIVLLVRVSNYRRGRLCNTLTTAQGAMRDNVWLTRRRHLQAESREEIARFHAPASPPSAFLALSRAFFLAFLFAAALISCSSRMKGIR